MGTLTYHQKNCGARLVAELNKVGSGEYDLSKDFFSVGQTTNEPILTKNDSETGNSLLRAYESEIGNILGSVNPLGEKGQEAIARLLWQVPGLFRYDGKEPFVLRNKSRSPIYFNCRLVPSESAIMNTVIGYMQFEYENATVDCAQIVMGGETAGIIYADRLASVLGLPSGVVRKKVKEHGAGGNVDGNIRKGDTVLLVEDLITDGGSKGPFIENIERCGGIVDDVFVLFDRQQGGGEYLLEKGIGLHVGTTMDIFLDVGKEDKELTHEQIEDINSYREDAKQWNLDRDYKWPTD